MILGAADKFFYYNYSGDASFEILLRVALKEEADPKKLQIAADKALSLYPELRFRVRVENNRFVAEDNPLPVVVVPESEKSLYFGSADTNGHQMFLTYEQNRIGLHMFHGWTDYSGFMTYLRALFYQYAALTGHALTENELSELLPTIRTAAPDMEGIDREDFWTPYEKYSDLCAALNASSGFSPAFSIPYKPYPYGCCRTNTTTVEIRTSDFIAETKRLDVSFVPLITDLISGAVRRQYDVGDEAVTAMIPADLRPIFSSKTVTNFSDGMNITCFKADMEKTQKERCDAFKKRMLEQMTKENFALLLGGKVKTVEGYENDPRTLFEVAAEKRRPKIPGAPTPVTYCCSYVGRITLTAGLDRMLEDAALEVFCRVHAVFVYTFGDSMRFFITNRTDETDFPDAITEALNRQGFDPKLVNREIRTQNKYAPEKLL